MIKFQHQLVIHYYYFRSCKIWTTENLKIQTIQVFWEPEPEPVNLMAKRFSETSLTTFPVTQRHIPEDGYSRLHHYKNFKIATYWK